MVVASQTGTAETRGDGVEGSLALHETARRVMQAVDRQRVLEQYRERVKGYDRHMWFARRGRRAAVERLGLRPGGVVADVGCGTGLSFAAVEARIGPDGRLIGVELSPEMLELARERVERHGWQNVELIEAAAEEAQLPESPEALLFVYTHDVLRSPAALSNLFGQAGPRARVAATGGKWPPRWALPVYGFVRWQAPRYVTTLEGFDQPWTRLQEYVPDLRVQQNWLLAGAEYVAWGTAGGAP
jgi:SAM-dependent methyltransferase